MTPLSFSFFLFELFFHSFHMCLRLAITACANATQVRRSPVELDRVPIGAGLHSWLGMVPRLTLRMLMTTLQKFPDSRTFSIIRRVVRRPRAAHVCAPRTSLADRQPWSCCLCMSKKNLTPNFEPVLAWDMWISTVARNPTCSYATV